MLLLLLSSTHSSWMRANLYVCVFFFISKWNKCLVYFNRTRKTKFTLFDFEKRRGIRKTANYSI